MLTNSGINNLFLQIDSVLLISLVRSVELRNCLLLHLLLLLEKLLVVILGLKNCLLGRSQIRAQQLVIALFGLFDVLIEGQVSDLLFALAEKPLLHKREGLVESSFFLSRKLLALA